MLRKSQDWMLHHALMMEMRRFVPMEVPLTRERASTQQRPMQDGPTQVGPTQERGTPRRHFPARG